MQSIDQPSPPRRVLMRGCRSARARRPASCPRKRASLLRSIPVCAVVALLLVFQPAGFAAAFDLGQLMQLLAQVRAGEASFTEQREVAVLDRALESSGRLCFEAPDTLVRETVKPRSERMAVSGNTLTLSQGGRSRTLELDSMPEAAVMVDAIRGTLTGNRDALERNFSVEVSGSAAHWTLDLVPLDARLRGQVASVSVAGDGSVVHEVRIAMADGDRSLMTITPLPVAGAPTSASQPGASPARSAAMPPLAKPR